MLNTIHACCGFDFRFLIFALDRFMLKKSRRMNIRFLLQSGGSLNLKLDANITVKDIKTILSQKTSRPSESLVLVHLGQILADDNPLSSLKFDLRSYIFVGGQPPDAPQDEDSVFETLFTSLPAPKVLKYRLRLEANPHALKAIAEKVCRGDTALAERLVASPERFLQHLGINVSLFTYRSILRDEDDKEPARPPLPPPEEDHLFDSYPCNIVADDYSEHHPSEEQPELPARGSGGGGGEGTSHELTMTDIAALTQLALLGIPIERALPLYLQLGRNMQATYRAFLLMALGNS
jgi:hypothetical protein